MREISISEALEDGIYTRHTEMDNCELRYRLIGSDNSAYIRTVAKESSWQNSHMHEFCCEHYIVQDGTVFICKYIDEKFKIFKLKQGDQMLIEPGVIHNVYMCENAVTHTVKFGKCVENDWNGSELCDEFTHNLSLKQLELLMV